MKKGRKAGRTPQDSLRLLMLGRQITAARDLMGLSQRELARRVESSQNAISNIENGNTDPSYTLLSKIAEVLETTLERLRTPIPSVVRQEEEKERAASKKEPSPRGAKKEPAR